MSKEKFKKIFKILFVGAAGVGKTALIEQFSDKKLHENTAPKTGVNFFIKEITVDDDNYKLQFWDIIDDEKYGSLQNLYYTGASAVFFVFDLSKPETFNYYQTHFKIIQDQVKLECPVFLIGNKLDLVENIESINREKYREFAKQEGLLGYIELTSMNNINNLLNTIPKFIQKALKKSYQVKFLVNNKELEEIRKYAKRSHQSQSEFIRSAIWEKIKLVEAPPTVKNSFKNKNVGEDKMRSEELKRIRELLEKLDKKK